MPTCIETRIPTVAIQLFHALKEGNAAEAERYFRMIQGLIQYEQGAVANAENSVAVSENDVVQRILADLRSDPQFQSLAQVPARMDSWATWAATHPLPPKGPDIARVIYDYDPCLSAPVESSTGSSALWTAVGIGTLGLATVLFLAQKS